MNFRKLILNSSVVIMTSLLAFVPSNSQAKDLNNVKVEQKSSENIQSKKYWINDDTDLFKENNEHSKIIEVLDQGDNVKVEKIGDVFAKVSVTIDSKNYVGFIYKSYLSEKEVKPDPNKFEGWVNIETKVFDSKEKEAKELGLIDKDSEIKGHIDGDNLRITYFGRTAYIQAKNTTKESPKDRDARLAKERKIQAQKLAEKRKKEQEEKEKQAQSAPKNVSGRTITMRSTAYTSDPSENGGYSTTAMGTAIRYGVAAVDPNVIPLGTRLYIEGYGYARAEDTGGAIKGNKIDLVFGSKSQSNNWGRRTVRVTILN
ncbi:MAG: 3D domain-containing protein [Finegoldia magna]|uniref:3D domain protein n=1 Tax=Finegoldia magna BVS033A4 TaxID=866773 RepID=E1KWU3_FINMA|nr:3D domain-containing protein [Finegoldia magna]EFL54426.1 3D domain protein [Finegoldia magna BVS033A4]MDU5271819.1 3D domain-containing protein [Finegoldia magna]MDU5743252.1 3D domain-containing protein [Finegoldia magna]